MTVEYCTINASIALTESTALIAVQVNTDDYIHERS